MMLKNDRKILAKLGTISNEDKFDVSQSIIDERQIFQGFSSFLFNKKIKRNDIKYVLKYGGSNKKTKAILLLLLEISNRQWMKLDEMRV